MPPLFGSANPTAPVTRFGLMAGRARFRGSTAMWPPRSPRPRWTSRAVGLSRDQIGSTVRRCLLERQKTRSPAASW